MSAPPLSLKGRAVQWLSQREHSRQELRRKLLTHLRNVARREAARADTAPTRANARAEALGDAEDTDPAAAYSEQVDAVLDWLVANRYLSEARFVESRVHVRGARYGNLRIKHELAQHGVALTAEQSQQLQTTEFDRAQAVWSRKFGAAPVDLRERAKHMRFLAARGFSMPVIMQVLKRARTALPDADSEADRGSTWGDAGD